MTLYEIGENSLTKVNTVKYVNTEKGVVGRKTSMNARFDEKTGDLTIILFGSEYETINFFNN